MTRMGGRETRATGTRSIVSMAAVTIVVAVASTAAVSPAHAYTRPGNTELVSLSSDGFSLDQPSLLRDMTPDGRFVVFQTQASKVLGDLPTGQVVNIFVRDRVTGAVEWVTRALNGQDSNGLSQWGASISDDGRFVAFGSAASNLVEGDTNNAHDIFIRDRATGELRKVTAAPDGSQANGSSDWPALSGNGEFVAYCSFASNLVASDTNNAADTFITKMSTGETERVSVASDETQANKQGCGLSQFSGPAISVDGRFVAFDSSASNLASNDLNDTFDVFVRDRATGTTEVVSVGASNRSGSGESYYPSISADGRYVGFVSWAPDLVPGDSGIFRDVEYFIRDREAQVTERISVSSAGAEGTEEVPGITYQGDPSMQQPSAISADGRFVAFLSWSSTLAPGDVNGGPDVFVRDRWAKTTERVTLAIDEAQARRSNSTLPLAISADGRIVGFTSLDPKLVPGDGNGFIEDVFIRARGPAAGIGDIRLHTLSDSLRFAGWARISYARLADAGDPGTDGDERFRPLGAEITSASVIQRPEEEDLLLSTDLTTLPSVATGANAFSSRGIRGAAVGSGVAAPLVFGFDLTVDGVRYQVRGTTQPAARPTFGLYRCTASCVEVGALSGGIGADASNVHVSVPMETIEAFPGFRLTALRAFTAVGEARLGGLQMTDEVALPDATVRGGSTRLGLAPSASSEGAVSYKTETSLVDGEWVEILSVAGLNPGNYRAWVKTCFDSSCWSANRTFEVN